MPIYHPPIKQLTPAQKKHQAVLQASVVESEKNNTRVGKTIKIHQKDKKREYRLGSGWVIEDIPWKIVKNSFRPVLGEWLSRRIQENGDKKTVVVSWGCGTGRDINELAKEFGEKVATYGFGREAYKSWLTTPHSTLVHADAWGTLRFLKNHSVDCIYGHHSLIHFFDMEPENATTYLISLTKKLKTGGKLVFDMREKPLWWSSLAQQADSIASLKIEKNPNPIVSKLVSYIVTVTRL